MAPAREESFVRRPRQTVALIVAAVMALLVFLFRFWPQLSRWIEDHQQWLD
jgi:hypothetical protein